MRITYRTAAVTIQNDFDSKIPKRPFEKTVRKKLPESQKSPFEWHLKSLGNRVADKFYLR